MWGAKRLHSPSDVADLLEEAAALIKSAAALLDGACCGAPAALVARVEAVEGQSVIDHGLALRLTDLAKAIQAEAELEEAEAA